MEWTESARAMLLARTMHSSKLCGGALDPHSLEERIVREELGEEPRTDRPRSQEVAPSASLRRRGRLEPPPGRVLSRDTTLVELIDRLSRDTTLVVSD